jgi:hypothetical protein
MLNIQISPGEFLDKLTILEIKRERIADPAKLAHVRRELDLLYTVWTASRLANRNVLTLVAKLKEINETLWEIEERVRGKEQIEAFDLEFIELSRSVYRTNDHRSAIKRLLNVMLNSELMEEKSYDQKMHNESARMEA